MRVDIYRFDVFDAERMKDLMGDRQYDAIIAHHSLPIADGDHDAVSSCLNDKTLSAEAALQTDSSAATMSRTPTNGLENANFDPFGNILFSSKYTLPNPRDIPAGKVTKINPEYPQDPNLVGRYLAGLPASRALLKLLAPGARLHMTGDTVDQPYRGTELGLSSARQELGVAIYNVSADLDKLLTVYRAVCGIGVNTVYTAQRFRLLRAADKAIELIKAQNHTGIAIVSDTTGMTAIDSAADKLAAEVLTEAGIVATQYRNTPAETHLDRLGPLLDGLQKPSVGSLAVSLQLIPSDYLKAATAAEILTVHLDKMVSGYSNIRAQHGVFTENLRMIQNTPGLQERITNSFEAARVVATRLTNHLAREQIVRSLARLVPSRNK